jgi:hypothetical protein
MCSLFAGSFVCVKSLERARRYQGRKFAPQVEIGLAVAADWVGERLCAWRGHVPGPLPHPCPYTGRAPPSSARDSPARRASAHCWQRKRKGAALHQPWVLRLFSNTNAQSALRNRWCVGIEAIASRRTACMHEGGSGPGRRDLARQEAAPRPKWRPPHGPLLARTKFPPLIAAGTV